MNTFDHSRPVHPTKEHHLDTVVREFAIKHDIPVHHPDDFNIEHSPTSGDMSLVRNVLKHPVTGEHAGYYYTKEGNPTCVHLNSPEQDHTTQRYTTGVSGCHCSGVKMGKNSRQPHQKIRIRNKKMQVSLEKCPNKKSIEVNYLSAEGEDYNKPAPKHLRHVLKSLKLELQGNANYSFADVINPKIGKMLKRIGAKKRKSAGKNSSRLYTGHNQLKKIVHESAGGGLHCDCSHDANLAHDEYGCTHAECNCTRSHENAIFHAGSPHHLAAIAGRARVNIQDLPRHDSESLCYDCGHFVNNHGSHGCSSGCECSTPHPLMAPEAAVPAAPTPAPPTGEARCECGATSQEHSSYSGGRATTGCRFSTRQVNTRAERLGNTPLFSRLQTLPRCACGHTNGPEGAHDRSGCNICGPSHSSEGTTAASCARPYGVSDHCACGHERRDHDIATGCDHCNTVSGGTRCDLVHGAHDFHATSITPHFTHPDNSANCVCGHEIGAHDTSCADCGGTNPCVHGRDQLNWERARRLDTENVSPATHCPTCNHHNQNHGRYSDQGCRSTGCQCDNTRYDLELIGRMHEPHCQCGHHPANHVTYSNGTAACEERGCGCSSLSATVPSSPNDTCACSHTRMAHRHGYCSDCGEGQYEAESHSFTRFHLKQQDDDKGWDTRLKRYTKPSKTVFNYSDKVAPKTDHKFLPIEGVERNQHNKEESIPEVKPVFDRHETEGDRVAQAASKQYNVPLHIYDKGLAHTCDPERYPMTAHPLPVAPPAESAQSKLFSKDWYNESNAPSKEHVQPILYSRDGYAQCIHYTRANNKIPYRGFRQGKKDEEWGSTDPKVAFFNQECILHGTHKNEGKDFYTDIMQYRDQDFLTHTEGADNRKVHPKHFYAINMALKHELIHHLPQAVTAYTHPINPLVKSQLKSLGAAGDNTGDDKKDWGVPADTIRNKEAKWPKWMNESKNTLSKFEPKLNTVEHWVHAKAHELGVPVHPDFDGCDCKLRHKSLDLDPQAFSELLDAGLYSHPPTVHSNTAGQVMSIHLPKARDPKHVHRVVDRSYEHSAYGHPDHDHHHAFITYKSENGYAETEFCPSRSHLHVHIIETPVTDEGEPTVHVGSTVNMLKTLKQDVGDSPHVNSVSAHATNPKVKSLLMRLGGRVFGGDTKFGKSNKNIILSTKKLSEENEDPEQFKLTFKTGETVSRLKYTSGHYNAQSTKSSISRSASKLRAVKKNGWKPKTP